MTKSDTRLIDPRDIGVGIGLLTRLPFGGDATYAMARGAAAAWTWPIVGLMLALCAALIAWLFSGLGPALCAALALLTSMILTGALHEDGLADCADGFWGGYTPERRLEIMKDSHIGSYGTLALIASLGLRALALATLAANGHLLVALCLAAMLSRAAMVWVMYTLPHARPGGLSASVGRPSFNVLSLAWAGAKIAALLIAGWAGIAAIIAAFLAALTAQSIANAKIGGQTGDVLGATQQIAEIAVLLALVIAL